MASWDKDCRACKVLWTTLFSLKQLFTTFDESGELAIGDLSFYNKLGGSELRKQEATALTTQLDKFLTGVRGAQYAEPTNQNQALSEMLQILMQEKSKVKDLAKAVKSNYVFI